MRWTKDQEKAITAQVSNLLVTAAAGAGKTQVLSGRILRRVQEGVDIDRILVITFTRAAAAEMKERIGRQLEEAAALADGNQHLARQMTLLQNAQITTIHAFCKDVVSAYFYQIGIDPGFRMGDEAEVTLLKYEALDRVLEESYAGGDEGFLQFAKCFHGARSDDAICNMVLSLYDFLQSLADMDAWLCSAQESYQKNFPETYVAKALLGLAVQNIRDAKSVLHSALAMVEQDSAFGPYVTMFQEDLAMTGRVLEKAESWDEFYAALSGASFGRRKILKNADEGTKQAADSLRDMAKDMYKTAASFIYCTADAAGEQMAAGRENVAALCRLVQNFHAYFTQSKREKNILDFNDLEHLALSILAEKDETGQLVPSEAAKEVGARYHEIYIDEYQDTNEIQEAIFTMVSGFFDDKPNIFMVGDMKQSIYRFRQTSPELFKEKKETYVPDGEKFNKVNLSLNFRSRKQVLYGINEIFKAVMSEACGEVCYNEDEMLHPGLTAYTQTPPAVEKTDICVIDLAGEPEGEEELTKTAAEARLVAQKINAFMADESFTVLDKETGEFRRLRYRDIAVLLRATRGKSEVFEKELASAGIPVFCDGQTPYFENSEIEIMLSLLAIIDNPLQDIPLVSVMRSPIFNFTEPELLDVRLAFGEGYFYDGVARQEGEKFQNFVASLSRWRRLSQTMGVRDLLALLYRETNWVEFCAMQQNGAQKKANLNLLLERASRFEATSFKGLFRFLGYVERAKSRGASDGGSAKLVGEDMDVVRIMSIHKSKGLEFPVVFLSNAGGQFNRMDLNGPLLCHKKAGLGLAGVDLSRRVRYSPPAKVLIRQMLSGEALSEEMRVLYVALTRAREKLVITGTVRDLEKAEAKWALCVKKDGVVLPGQILSAHNYLDWIMFGISGSESGLFDVSFYQKANLQKAPAPGSAAEETAFLPPTAEIDRRLGYSYRHKNLFAVPAKVTVTELKRRFAEPEEGGLQLEIKQPNFIKSEKDFTSLQKGVIMHYIMENVDFRRNDISQQVRNLSAGLKEGDILKICAFFDGPLGVRLKKADKVYREAPFTFGVPANSLDESFPESEAAIVQGTIDCFFEEDGKLVLIDYKTDRYAHPDEIRRRYQKQIDLYALALEKKYLKKVSEKYIYLFEKCDILSM